MFGLELQETLLKDCLDYRRELVLIMYSIINNISPSYLNKFVHNRPICQYGLRSNSSHTLHVPFPHTESFKKSLQYSGSQLWNKLPLNIKESQTLSIFKFHCKQ